MQPLEWLHSRRSVWVIGDATQARDWRRVIASLMGAQEEEIAIVGLKTTPNFPQKRAFQPRSTMRMGRIIE